MIEMKKPKFIAIREYRGAVIKDNRIVPGISNSSHSNGSYVCVFFDNAIYRTKIFVISSIGKYLYYHINKWMEFQLTTSGVEFPFLCFVDIVSRPKLSPAKREFTSGDEISCVDERGADKGYYIIDVFHKNTNIPLVSKQLSRATLYALYVTEITITCTSKNSYLNFHFEEKNVSFSALIRRKSCHVIPFIAIVLLSLPPPSSSSIQFMKAMILTLVNNIPIHSRVLWVCSSIDFLT